ncbi:MAG TPA: prolipoprotein diacylglyceryl transferase [Peptococcaceae bacterium]|nr:MAG: Prolipoprotein diacylglyceryl transferase [Moorella sp. 60_41]HBT46602.1 prolipoprotein diacylglyceryl transferase [Peptococcaceae bacterium]
MLLDLNPVAFHIGPLAVRWYGIFMAISFLVGAWYLYQEGMRRGLREDFLLNLAMIVVVAGVVGARLLFVLANYPEWFVREPVQVLKIYEGGLAWHGGLLGGVLAGWWYVRRHKKEFNLLADLAVPGLALGYAMIRIANVFNQEVLGRPTDLWFGRWPAQPIGTLIGLVLLLRYFYVERKNPPSGYQFWSFIFYHQLLRGLIEETVRENPLEVWGYVVPHWGLGFFTLAQLTTPLIMLLAYYFMRKARLKGPSGGGSYRLTLFPRPRS